MSCPRCGGYIVYACDDAYCLNCSARVVLALRPVVYRTQGSQCDCGLPAALGGVCHACRYKDHAAKIRAGMDSHRICRTDGCEALCARTLYYCADHRPTRIRYDQKRKAQP